MIWETTKNKCIPFNLLFGHTILFFIESNYFIKSKILIKLDNFPNVISYITLYFIYVLSHYIIYVLLFNNQPQNLA